MKEDLTKTNLSGSDNDEDLRVIADMSRLEPRSGLFGRRVTTNKFSPENKKSVDISSEGLRAAIKGALAATLAIYFVYAAAFGIFIYLLTRIL